MFNYQDIFGLISTILGIILTSLKILEQFDKVSPKIKEYLNKATNAWIILIVCLFGYSLTYFIFRAQESKPENLSAYIDLNKNDELILLNVCDNSLLNDWWENCAIDNSMINVKNELITGNNYIEVEMEPSLHKDQVYSINIPIKTPTIADTLTANIYVPDKDLIHFVTFAVIINGDSNWYSSEYFPNIVGWHTINLDLHNFELPDGNPAQGNNVSFIHIDFYVPKTANIPANDQVKIKDVMLFYPSSSHPHISP